MGKVSQLRKMPVRAVRLASVEPHGCRGWLIQALNNGQWMAVPRHTGPLTYPEAEAWVRGYQQRGIPRMCDVFPGSDGDDRGAAA